tara:strand:- start:4523 stop:4981 length:459 start_codon:yes stop_codon:yes gene_type:complete
MINAEILVESKNWKKIVRNPKRLILNTLKKFPKKYRFVNQKVYISVLFTTNKKIQLLNNRFRKKNKPTDILSFPFYDKKNIKNYLKRKEFYLGDIVISCEAFSKKNKGDYKKGLVKIFIHGFLHLLNYDHKSNKDYLIMNSMENKIFQEVKG